MSKSGLSVADETKARVLLYLLSDARECRRLYDAGEYSKCLQKFTADWGHIEKSWSYLCDKYVPSKERHICTVYFDFLESAGFVLGMIGDALNYERFASYAIVAASAFDDVPKIKLHALLTYARICQSSGRLDEEGDVLNLALEYVQSKSELSSSQAMLLQLIGTNMVKRKQPAQLAEGLFIKARELATAAAEPNEIIYSNCALADLSLAAGDISAARDLLEKAQMHLKDAIDTWALTVEDMLIRCLIAEGRQAEATAQAERIKQTIEKHYPHLERSSQGPRRL